MPVYTGFLQVNTNLSILLRTTETLLHIICKYEFNKTSTFLVLCAIFIYVQNHFIQMTVYANNANLF